MRKKKTLAIAVGNLFFPHALTVNIMSVLNSISFNGKILDLGLRVCIFIYLQLLNLPNFVELRDFMNSYVRVIVPCGKSWAQFETIRLFDKLFVDRSCRKSFFALNKSNYRPRIWEAISKGRFYLLILLSKCVARAGAFSFDRSSGNIRVQ